MKYIIVLGDGMADRPIAELGGRTPLETAKTPFIDGLAVKSEIGLAKTIPNGMKPGSDTANLAVLGYNPEKYYSGRSPLEALSIGVPMRDSDIALRANIVTVSEDEPFEEKIIIDHSSGEISTEDAGVLLEAIRPVVESGEFRFYLGTSYRHCVIWDQGEVVDLAQPHDHLGEKIAKYLPVNFSGEGESDKAIHGREMMTEMMKKSFEILNHHPLNEERRKKGLNPANCLWFWGAGTKPMLDPFYDKTGKTGAMISAVDLLKGIAVGADMKVIIVDGANGQLETNYEGKACGAVDALLKDGLDFVYVHVEAPDEMGHQGSVERKIKSIEYLDERLIKRIWEKMQASGENFRMLILPDHPTPIEIRTHSSEPVPYLLYDSTEDYKNPNGEYNEKFAESTGIFVEQGYKLIDKLFQK